MDDNKELVETMFTRANEKYNELIDFLENVFYPQVNNNDSVYNSVPLPGSIANKLNEIFRDALAKQWTCAKVYVSDNRNLPFGIMVSPIIDETMAYQIVITSDPVVYGAYSVDIDLNAIRKGLTPQELAAVIVWEVFHAMDAARNVQMVRYIMDRILMDEALNLNFKAASTYPAILAFGIKETIRKVHSIIYKGDMDLIDMSDDEAVPEEVIEIFKISDDLVNAKEKLKSCVYGDGSEVQNPNMGVLRWCMSAYVNVRSEWANVRDTLLAAKMATGSELQKDIIDHVLSSLNWNDQQIANEAAILEESVKGFSLFRSMKQNGLKAIEDDLYEFKIRLKNCDHEDDAIYILRQINTRIGILEDYMENTELSDSEMERWRGVCMAYRQLRIDLDKKKLMSKRRYGVFVDYDKLDQLDN